MNRLQKKCVIGTAGIHLLLLVILIFGPGFFNPAPKADNQILDVIPSNLVDNALSQGARDAQAPPPAPAPPPIPQRLLQGPPPIPTPTPQKTVEPPAPAPVPAPSFLTRMVRYFHTPARSEPAVTPNLTHVERTEKSQTDTSVKVNLTKVKRSQVKNNSNTQSADNARAINATLRSLNHSLSSATKVDMPGNADASAANYRDVVESVYFRAILANLPGALSGNNENTRVTITIASDGSVIASTIVSPSGDPAWDNAVQQTLNQVTFVAPFPAGAAEKERHYTLDFNPQVERELQ